MEGWLTTTRRWRKACSSFIAVLACSSSVCVAPCLIGLQSCLHSSPVPSLVHARKCSALDGLGWDGMWGSFQFRVISLCKQTPIAKCNIYVQNDSTRPVCHLIHSSQPSSQPASSVTTVSISLFVLVFSYVLSTNNENFVTRSCFDK